MIDIPFPSRAPTKLYALVLKLRPIQQGTLMPFSGEFVHAALLNWLKATAPDVATWLPEGTKRRLFTCSSLQFPMPEPRMREAERRNVHLPLDPEKTYTIRITLLLGELFPLFHEALMRFNEATASGQKSPFMQLGKQVFLLEEVIAEPEESPGWADCTSFGKLVDWARTLRLGRIETLELEFASLTTFNRSNKRSQVYGGHFALLPLPKFVFQGLVRRWQELAPPELEGIVQGELIEQYIENDGIIISDYALRPHQVCFANHLQRGFVGRCVYDTRGPDEKVTEDGALTVRQQILLLARLAFYCGIGYKTAMGLGQVRLRREKE
jgi:CRISPR-associated endoribonuclease Cas6